MVQGERIRQQDSDVPSVCFPLSGVLSTIINLADGRSVEAAMTGPDGMAEISALGTGHAVGDHLVQVSGEGFMLHASHLLRVMQSSPGVMRMVCLAVEISTAYSLQSLACLNYHHIESRFCRWMLMAHYQLRTDKFSLTHEFMASMLGVQRTSITVVANKLQTDGLISYHRGRLAILDVDRLRQRTCECYRRMTYRIEIAFPNR